MPRENAIELEGTIVEVLPRNVFRVELANGHRLVAFPIRKIREWASKLALGDTVTVEVSPYDFSSARLRMKQQNNEES